MSSNHKDTEFLEFEREAPDFFSYIFIDIDGLLANFDKLTDSYPNISPRRNVCRTVKGFYTNLEIFDGAKEFIDKLEKAYPLRIRFLSATVLERPDVWTEKFLWIQKHFPNYQDRLILAKTKEAVGSYNDILVDDNPTWNGAKYFRGTVIKFNTENIPNEYDRIYQILLDKKDTLNK